jgi:hypothetical protein
LALSVIHRNTKATQTGIDFGGIEKNPIGAEGFAGKDYAASSA